MPFGTDTFVMQVALYYTGALVFPQHGGIFGKLEPPDIICI